MKRALKICTAVLVCVAALCGYAYGRLRKN